MPHIHVIPPSEASGSLQREYEAARLRAGRIWNIVSIQSQTPKVLKASLRLYREVMYGPSPLTRAQREMLAVVVSQSNECDYRTQAHLYDLRAEVADQDLADRFAVDWRAGALDSATAALLSYAEKLTMTPEACGPDDIERLREAGWDDEGISGAVQVIAYFNYINRIATGLGVELEFWIDRYGRPLD